MAEEEPNEESLTEGMPIYCTLGLNIWLKGKEDPMFASMKVKFFNSSRPADIEELTDTYANIILHQMDSRSSFALTLEDERENKFIIQLDQVQAFHVVAPEKMPDILLKDDEDDE